MIQSIQRVLRMAGGLLGATVAVAAFSSVANASATLSSKTPPPDSYLATRVNTVSELCQQVSNNPTVREHYAHVFHVPQSEVVSYFRRNLVESYVPTAMTFPVWCVTPSGRHFTINQTFKAGTRVFALRDGSPVLKWACGNPLSSRLPSAIELRRSVAKRSLVPTSEVMPYTEATTAFEATPAIPVSGTITSTPMESSFEVPVSDVKGTVETYISPVTSSGGNALSIASLGGIAGLLSKSTSGGSALTSSVAKFTTNGGTDGTDGGSGGTTTTTPEPSSALVLVIGLGGLGALALRRRKLSDMS